MFETRRRANAKRKSQRKNALTTAAVLGLLALLLFLVGRATSYPLFYLTALLAVLFLLFPLVTALGTLMSETGIWDVGAEGEETVARLLSSLGDDYHVVHDVALPGMRGNVDHVVLGHNGVFVIETKNHKGFIACNGDSWTQRKIGQLGTPYLGRIGCPSKQVKRNAILLSRLIRSRLGIGLYVNSAIVFTNKAAYLRVENSAVPVFRPDDLCQFIKTYASERMLTDTEIKKLEELIRPCSQFQ